MIKCVIESAQNSTRDVPQNLQLSAVYKMVVQYKLNCPVGMLRPISQRNISLQSTHTYIHAWFKNILPLPALVRHYVNFRFALIRKCFAPIRITSDKTTSPMKL